jgi:choline transport protein
MVEGTILVLHIVGFFAILIPLWVLAPTNSSKEVFTQFQNLGGWSSQGLSFMVGLLSPIYTLLGVDSAVHMSEETRDASLVLPRATFAAILINGFFGYVMTITFCFTVGDPAAILETYTGYPFIQSFYNITGSYAGASIMVAIIITTITSSVISTVATVSRQLWSFGRDNAMPFSPFIAHVSLIVPFLTACIDSVIDRSFQDGRSHSTLFCSPYSSRRCYP